MKGYYYAILAVIGVAVVSAFLYIGTSEQDHVIADLGDNTIRDESSAGSAESGTGAPVPDGEGNDTKHYVIDVGDSPQIGN